MLVRWLAGLAPRAGQVTWMALGVSLMLLAFPRAVNAAEGNGACDNASGCEHASSEVAPAAPRNAFAAEPRDSDDDWLCAAGLLAPRHRRVWVPISLAEGASDVAPPPLRRAHHGSIEGNNVCGAPTFGQPGYSSPGDHDAGAAPDMLLDGLLSTPAPTARSVGSLAIVRDIRDEAPQSGIAAAIYRPPRS